MNKPHSKLTEKNKVNINKETICMAPGERSGLFCVFAGEPNILLPCHAGYTLMKKSKDVLMSYANNACEASVIPCVVVA